jgi:hypothetical protein
MSREWGSKIQLTCNSNIALEERVKMRLDKGQDSTRTIEVEFDEGNFLITEEIKGMGKDVIWMTPDEVIKLNDFKKKMTGEIS